MSSLPVEHHFGRCRTQSVSAELSVKSYWQASARDMLRSSKRHKSDDERRPTGDVVPALTPDEFFAASQSGYRAALRLASFCAGVTPASLSESYVLWCNDKTYLDEEPVLGDEPELEELLEMEQDAPNTTACLEQMQNDVAMQEELDPGAPEPDIEEQRLKNLADADGLRQVLAAVPESKADAEEIPPQSPTKGTVAEGMPMNLYHSLWGLGPHATESEIFDSVFRLVAYLRFWKGGCDREWVKHPKALRSKSSKLNWFQCLGADWFLRDSDSKVYDGLCLEMFCELLNMFEIL